MNNVLIGPCYLTRFAVFSYQGWNPGATGVGTFNNACAAIAAFDITTVAWGTTYKMLYNTDGTQHPPAIIDSSLNNPNWCGCYSGAAVAYNNFQPNYENGAYSNYDFTLYHGQIQFLCPRDYCIAGTDWLVLTYNEGTYPPFYPAPINYPNGSIPGLAGQFDFTGCTDYSTSGSCSTVIDVPFPSAGSSPPSSLTANTSYGVWNDGAIYNVLYLTTCDDAP
jgi:hypothetical protein